ENFRTYFIAPTTNAYSTMHYDIARSHKRHPLHALHTALQDASRRPAPPGVQQRDYVLLGHREVDRDAVGDGDRKQKPPSSGRVPVYPVYDQPPIAGGGMPLHRGAVHLMGQNHAGKARTDRRADGAPARHDLADVLFAPQAEREPVP